MAYDYISRTATIKNTKNDVFDGGLDASQFFNYDSQRTNNGYEFTWPDKNTCVIYGTSGTSGAFANILQYLYELPDFMPEGSMFEINATLPTGVYIETRFYMNDDSVVYYRAKTSGIYKIMVPYGTKYNTMRLYIPAATGSVDGTAKIYMTSLPSKAILTEPDFSYNDKTQNGIIFDWATKPSNPVWGVGMSCAVSGESEGLSFDVIYNQSIGGTRFKPGNAYYLDFNSTDKNIGIEILYTTAYGTESEIHWTPGYFVIPKSTTAIILRLRVNQYFTVNGTIDNISVREGAVDAWKPHKMITFIDDDTSTVDYCEKYYNACKHNGIVGNYAVIGKHVENKTGLLTDLLKYEDDGFGMLIHCYNQNDTHGHWTPVTYDAKLAYADMCKVDRLMDESGFTDYKHWVIPGGHVYYDNELIARRLGMKSMISTANSGYNVFTPFDPLYVKRASLDPTDTNSEKSLAYVKNIIDTFMADPEDGWLIVTTHFNEWGSLTWDTSLDSNGYPVGYSRFNEIVQYAINAGCEPKQYQEAFSYAVS